MLNVNVNVKCKCSVYMSDLRQNITIFTVIHSFQSHYKGYLAGKSEDVDQQWTSSSSAAYSITIAIKHRSYHNSQRYLEKNYIPGTCDPFTAPADIFISITLSKSLPELQCGDIYIYLIENPSPYTPQKLKAYQKHR